MRGVTALLAVWLLCCAVHAPDTRPRVTFELPPREAATVTVQTDSVWTRATNSRTLAVVVDSVSGGWVHYTWCASGWQHRRPVEEFTRMFEPLD
jgi:hypothetical protein